MPFFNELENKMAGKPPKNLSFEAALAELEQVIAALEAGKLPLEDALLAYQRGADMLQQCRGKLEAAQQQVQILEQGTLKNFTADTSNSVRPEDA